LRPLSKRQTECQHKHADELHKGSASR
jgi:hypothetical protein